jgi:hypothetical protein
VLAAVSVLAPALAPSFQLPTVAMPPAFVVGVRPVVEPPPLATAKVTLTPETGLLLTSVTRTLGAVATAVPGGAAWPLPALKAILLAPAASVKELEVAAVSAVGVKVSV